MSALSPRVERFLEQLNRAERDGGRHQPGYFNPRTRAGQARLAVMADLPYRLAAQAALQPIVWQLECEVPGYTQRIKMYSHGCHVVAGLHEAIQRHAKKVLQ